MVKQKFLANYFLVSVFFAISLFPIPQSGAESLWEIILRVTGISATPKGLKGPGDAVASGDLWVVNLSQKTRQRLTKGGGYRSPIFLQGHDVGLALQGEDVVRFRALGFIAEPEPVLAAKGITKLVGRLNDDSDKILILQEDGNGQTLVGVLSLETGKVTSVSYDAAPEAQRMLSHLRGWDREYGETRLYVKRKPEESLSGSTEYSDVYLKTASARPKNLTNCQQVNCSQPSLSSDGRLIVFVKESKP